MSTEEQALLKEALVQLTMENVKQTSEAARYKKYWLDAEEEFAKAKKELKELQTPRVETIPVENEN